MDAPEFAQLRTAIMSGNRSTDVDHARGCASLAVKMCRRLGVPYVTVGGGPAGPFSQPTAAGDVVIEQLTARWPVAGDQVPRTITECWGQVAACVQSVLGTADTPTPPAPAPGLPDGTTQGVQQWAANLTKGDVVAAGFKTTPWNSESGPPWPPPIVTGPDGQRCIAFTLGGGGKRIEVEPNHRTFPAGDDAWFGFAFYLAPGFPLASDDWQVVWQLHGNDTTSPQQDLQVHKGGLTIGDNHRIADLTTSRWYRVVIRASMDPRGTMSVWLDGTKVCDGYQAGLNNTPLYLKCGLYHSTAIAGGTIYQRGHALGTGYGAVYPT